MPDNLRDIGELPNPALCRAKDAGFGGYIDCLVEYPYGCMFALRFGNGWFCRHPENKAIVARTEAEKQRSNPPGN